VRVGHYRIDMVVEGHNDARLAVECDGDRYHGADKWAADTQRERDIRRAGWGAFWRCFYSEFVRRRKEMLDDLFKTLAERGIEPTGAKGAPRSVHVEHRVVSFGDQTANQGGGTPVEGPEPAPPTTPARVSTPADVSGRSASTEADVPPVEARLHPNADDADPVNQDQTRVPSSRLRALSLPFSDYTVYASRAGDDPREVSATVVSEGLAGIIEVEGPVVAKRVYEIYLRGCGIKRMGHELKSSMNGALAEVIRQGRVVSEDELAKDDVLFSVVRVNGTPPIRLRNRGPRAFEEIPPSELQVVARYLVERHGVPLGSEAHLRAILECFDLKRLTTQVDRALREILERRFPHVDEFLGGMGK